MNIYIITPTNSVTIENNFYSNIIKQNTTGFLGLGFILVLFVVLNIMEDFKHIDIRYVFDFLILAAAFFYAFKSFRNLKDLNTRELKIDLVSGKIFLGQTEFPIKDKTIYYKPNGKVEFTLYGLVTPKARFYALDLGYEDTIDINLDSNAFSQVQDFIKKNTDYRLEENTNFVFPKIL